MTGYRTPRTRSSNRFWSSGFQPVYGVAHELGGAEEVDAGHADQEAGVVLADGFQGPGVGIEDLDGSFRMGPVIGDEPLEGVRVGGRSVALQVAAANVRPVVCAAKDVGNRLGCPGELAGGMSAQLLPRRLPRLLAGFDLAFDKLQLGPAVQDAGMDEGLLRGRDAGLTPGRRHGEQPGQQRQHERSTDGKPRAMSLHIPSRPA